MLLHWVCVQLCHYYYFFYVLCSSVIAWNCERKKMENVHRITVNKNGRVKKSRIKLMAVTKQSKIKMCVFENLCNFPQFIMDTCIFGHLWLLHLLASAAVTPASICRLVSRAFCFGFCPHWLFDMFHVEFAVVALPSQMTFLLIVSTFLCRSKDEILLRQQTFYQILSMHLLWGALARGKPIYQIARRCNFPINSIKLNNVWCY